MEGHRSNLVLMTMVAAGALVFGSTSSVTASLPPMAQELQATQTEVHAVADIYPVALAALVLPMGGLLDLYGRRRCMLIGLVVFTLSQFWSSIAGTPESLIASRLVAGIGAALVLPGTLATLSSVMTPEERPRAIAVWAGGMLMGGIVGLIMAGAAISLASWETAFVVMGLFGLGTLLATLAWVPETFDPDHAVIDVPGALRAAVAIGSLTLAIIEAPTRGVDDPVVIGAFVVGALALVSFIRWELSIPRPLLDLRLFQRPSFAIANLTLLVVYGVGFGWFFLSFQYTTFIYDYTAFQAGMCLVPTGLSVAFFAALSPRFSRRFGPLIVMSTGLACLGLGTAGMALLGSAESFWSMVPAFLLFGAGAGITSFIPTELIVEALPSSQQGVASAVNDASRELGAAIGIAILGSLSNAGYRERAGELLDGAPPALAGAVRDSPASSELLGAPGSAYDGLVTHTIHEGIVAGWQTAFAACAALALLTALGLVVRRVRHGELERRTADDPRTTNLVDGQLVGQPSIT